MRKIFRGVVVLVLLTGLALSGIFLVQQRLTYKEHISSAVRLGDVPHRVSIKHADGSVESATVQYADSTLVAAHARMGNEIEEHITILFVLNIVTFLLLIALCFITLRFMPAWPLKRPAWLDKLRRRRPSGFEVVPPKDVHPIR